ncbi:MAG TPA: EAL domain-containing protein, partial [Kineosporiaceae bacterium]|nr:EAL domain-containing protein [Kineosporiaceae bacterium]
VADGHMLAQRVAKVVLYSAVSLSAAIALIVGQRRHHLTTRRAPWLLLAAGQVVYFSADATFYTRHDLLTLEAFPSIADVLYAAHYPLLMAAMFLLIRQRSTLRDLAGVIDAAIITVAVALLSWVFLVSPSLAPGMGAVVLLGLLYQPLMDIAVLALALRLSMGGGPRNPSFYLLLAGMTVNLGTNCLFGVQQATGTYSSGNYLDAGWLSAYLMMGACALHPSMTRLSQPLSCGQQPVGRLRVGLLAAASLTAPLTLVVQDRIGRPVQVAVDAAACAMLFLLVLARLWGLLSAARSAAMTDELTSLANRAVFIEQVRSSLAQARRQGTHIAVLFLDIDRFKMINDAMGHAAGDQLLVEMASRLRSCLRSGDVAARHGGDEFAVMMTGMTSPEDGWAAAERLRNTVGEPLMVGQQRVDCSVSIGVAVDVDGLDGPEDLLRHADAALYRAKDAGRNRVELFDLATRETIKLRVADEVELRDALAGGEIVAWYQPVVDLRSGRIVGGEALARWIHPTRGLILPGMFLPLAMEVGLISTVSRRIALDTMDLRAEITDYVPASFRLSFNLGVGEFNLLEIIGRVMKATEGRDALRSGLTMEITETAVIHGLKEAGRALGQAREEGFAVALDDFGTGYSSLSLLRDLPLDIIKIDRSFVQRMAASPTDAAIVEGVVDLAARLGLHIIAEGVETDREVDHLMRLGAMHAQGFRYAPAVPAEEFTRWLRHGPPWLEDFSRLAEEGTE